MEEYLKYELTQQPPLFKDGQLRKNSKSDLARIITFSTSSNSFNGTQVVIDGGHLLHAGYEWPKDATYLDICHGYIFFCRSQGTQIEVIFDEYNSLNSTKRAEQIRRSAWKSSREYEFHLNMTPQTSREAFLSNI